MRKIVLALLGLVLLLSPAEAGIVKLGFEFNVALWPGTRFVLHVVSLRQGMPTQEDRLLDPLPVAQCAPGAEQLCASLCLEPGDYTLTLKAVRGNEQSDPSNELDIDLTSTTPCQLVPVTQLPPPAPKPSPSPPSSGPAKGIGAAAAAAAAVAAMNGGSSPSLADMVNLSCVQWAVTGPCFCGPYTPCVSVEYWEPRWLVETVKIPGHTVVPVLGELLQVILSNATAAWGGGGAGNTGGSGRTNIQYNEAHVYTFPQILGGPCTSCAPGNPPFTVHYASELDPLWRTATAIPSPLDLLQKIGVWAPKFPRGGKVIHSSEPVGSGVAAARAMDIAFNPVGEPPNLEARVVLQPTLGMSTCMQLASPRKTPCFTAGTPPPFWETATVSPRGTYLWLLWTKRRCCVDPTKTTCGITLPGVGGYGQNACVLPSTP